MRLVADSLPAGLLAGAILATTFQVLFRGHFAVFDTLLLASMLLAVDAFVRAYQGGGRADYLRFFLFSQPRHARRRARPRRWRRPCTAAPGLPAHVVWNIHGRDRIKKG